MPGLDSLPRDLILEIVLRLPVDSLLRFRSVSKHWRDLIDTPKFTKSHLNQATKSKSTTCVVFHNGSSYHLINLSSLRHEVTRDTLQKLDFPYPIENPYSHTRFLGSINGLICTYIGSHGIVVWNPFIRTKWLVPDTGYGLQFQLKFGFWFWGFGYDSVCDEYKVIRIASVPSDGDILMRVMVWIYSFNIGDWRRISDLRYHLVSGQRGIFLKNAVHWIVYHPTKVPHGSSLLIGSLDMRDEEFRLLPRPDCEKDDVFMMNLADLDGSLCMCCMHEDSGAFDLWVMKEYGVKESWSRLIRLDSGSRMLVPVTLSQYGREFLVDENFLGFLLWCDAETGLIKRKVHGLSPVIGVPNVHIPSLVRLNGANS